MFCILDIRRDCAQFIVCYCKHCLVSHVQCLQLQQITGDSQWCGLWSLLHCVLQYKKIKELIIYHNTLMVAEPRSQSNPID